MGRPRREVRLTVESCESRSLLSGGIGGQAAVVGMVSRGSAPSIRLEAGFSGQYQVNSPVPDVGRTYTITGPGIVHMGPAHGRGIHHASVTGDLHSLGFIAQGNAQGDLTLKGPHGTLALHLTGPQQAGFQPLPSQFRFTTSGGTGRFGKIHESGTAILDLTPGQTGTGGPGSGQGTFTIVLKSG